MRATNYAKKLAIDIAYNQHMFLGKKDYWFQPLCEKLGWEISDLLARRWRVVLFVVCADPKLIDKCTKDIEGSWACHRGPVTNALKNAAKKAEQKNKIKYPSTFALFKKLFPSCL